MKSIIIGAVTHYGIEHIYNWVKSIEKCGFAGEKIMIVYVAGDDLINFLKDNGFIVHRSSLNRHIVVQRFLDIYNVLSDLKGEYKYAISTDVKDVIFQYNPVEWLEKNLDDEKLVIASSECLKYKDEQWGRKNMLLSFPWHAATMMDKEIYNAGTLAGEFNVFKEFAKKIYDLSLSGNTPQPDQAAVNILTHVLETKMVRRTTQREGWCTQLGTVMEPVVFERSGKFLLEPQPVWNDVIKKMETSEGVEFALVHQYDRVPTLKQKIDKIYL